MPGYIGYRNYHRVISVKNLKLSKVHSSLRVGQNLCLPLLCRLIQLHFVAILFRHWVTSTSNEPRAWGNFSASPTWSTRTTAGCGARSTSSCVHRNLFWQLSRDGKLLGYGMSHATAISPEPSFRAPCRVGYAVVSRRNTGWQHQRADIPAHARTAHKDPLQKRPEDNICWIVLHVPPTTQSVKKVKWIELNEKWTVTQAFTRDFMNFFLLHTAFVLKRALSV